MSARARAILEAVRIVGVLVVLCSVVVIWMKPNPYVWWAVLVLIIFGFPAAIATIALGGDDRRWWR